MINACMYSQEPSTLESLLETLLYHQRPQKYNLPQLMFAITCKTKHVPQAIRNTLEMKGQCVPDTTVREFLSSMRESGLHEERIVSLLKSHGQVRKDIVFFRADNYQLTTIQCCGKCFRKRSDQGHGTCSIHQCTLNISKGRRLQRHTIFLQRRGVYTCEKARIQTHKCVYTNTKFFVGKHTQTCSNVCIHAMTQCVYKQWSVCIQTRSKVCRHTDQYIYAKPCCLYTNS